MKFLLAVPVFNEERYVQSVMREIRKYARAAAIAHGVDMRLLVVDDGSTDATPTLLQEMASRRHISLLTHPENRGYGMSLIDAFQFAASRGFDWVITMDCDEQHEPCRIPLFVRECLKDDADIISGTRYLRPATSAKPGEPDESTPPPDRRSINRIITDLLNSTLDLRILPPAGGCPELGDAAALPEPAVLTDAFCGFKAHRVAALQRMSLTIPGYAFPMQFWAQAAALRQNIRELPVKLIYKDATRHFGGILDDPTARLGHYLETLRTEIAATCTCADEAACVCPLGCASPAE